MRNVECVRTSSCFRPGRPASLSLSRTVIRHTWRITSCESRLSQRRSRRGRKSVSQPSISVARGSSTLRSIEAISFLTRLLWKFEEGSREERPHSPQFSALTAEGSFYPALVPPKKTNCPREKESASSEKETVGGRSDNVLPTSYGKKFNRSFAKLFEIDVKVQTSFFR